MKTTKNQAAAVRLYLATLGVSISHVQALEVIARGAGLRSRHVKAPAEQAASPAEAKFEEALALCAKRPYPAGKAETVKELMALLPELFTTPEEAEAFLEDSLDNSVVSAADEVCLANVIRASYISAGRTPEALAKALNSLVVHQVWNYKDYRTAFLFLTGSESYTGPVVSFVVDVPCQTKREPAPMEDLADDIKANYVDSGWTRADLHYAVTRLLAECGELFEGEKAAVMFLLEDEKRESLPTGAHVQDVNADMKRAWTPADIATAQSQGWDIFETNRDEADAQNLVDGKPYGHRPFELQRDDEQGIFANDVEAHAFVRKAAQKGDPVAVRALAFLEKYSPAEYAAIMSTPEVSKQQ